MALNNLTMKAIAQNVEGGVEELMEMTLPKPQPKSGELLVRVYASGINPTCSKQRTQKLPFAPFVLGRDGSGEVVEVGQGCTKFKVGDHVYFAGDRRTNGTNAEYTAVAEHLCGRKPERLSWGEAAAMPLVTLTAWEALVESMKIEPGSGRSILIVAGAGGVGSIAIQIAAKVLGLVVVATASRPETEAFCKDKGAHHVVNHRHDLKEQLEKIGIDKVDYVLNLADWGNDQLDAWTGVLKPLGHIVCIVPPKTALEPSTMTKLFFLRAQLGMELMWVRTLSDTEPEKQGQILNSAARLFDVGTLQSTLTKTLPFTENGLREGHKLSDSGTAVGKVVLVNSVAPRVGGA